MDGNSPVTLVMLRALIIEARRFPGAVENVLPIVINDVIDGHLRLDGARLWLTDEERR